jgi:hypothetical protein
MLRWTTDITTATMIHTKVSPDTKAMACKKRS